MVIMSNRRMVLAGVAVSLVLAIGTVAMTQPGNPPPPEKYKVTLRYDMPSPRDQHVALYKAMVEHLGRIGFVFEPPLLPFPNTDYEDAGKTLLTGAIARGQVMACFNDRTVASMLLVPSDYKLPEDANAPVRVRLELAGGFPAAQQQVLANQVRALLGQLDFKESVSY